MEQGPSGKTRQQARGGHGGRKTDGGRAARWNGGVAARRHAPPADRLSFDAVRDRGAVARNRPGEMPT